MARQKKDTVRATIRLQPQHKEVLDQLAHWSGISLSELMRGVIEPVMPVLASLVRTLRNVDCDPPPRTFAALADVMYWEQDAKKCLEDLTSRASFAEEVSRDDYMAPGTLGGISSPSSSRGGRSRRTARIRGEEGERITKKRAQPPYSNTGVTPKVGGGA